MDRNGSRLQAPAVRAPAKRGAATAPQRRPAATAKATAMPTATASATPSRRRASHDDPPPKLALHELQTPPAAATYLKRGSGRTIATRGSTFVVTPPLRRRSGGSPRRADKQAPDEAHEHKPAREEPLSPGTHLRQRKRSADMMDPYEDLQTNGHAVENHEQLEEVNEPPLANGNANVLPPAPMTPPPRDSTSSLQHGEGMPVSPREMKRMRRLTRSPKTPLGAPTYVADEGGLSATQRVRLSLSGYMTVANLTGRRDSGANGLNVSQLHSTSNNEDKAAGHEALTVPATTQSAPTALRESKASFAQSKFGASRSMSGPAQIASKLLPSMSAVDCLMGYIRELQRSEATLRVQLQKIRKQRHEELSRSAVRVSSLEMTITQVESERDSERRKLEEQERTIEALMAKISQLEESMQLRHQNGFSVADDTLDSMREDFPPHSVATNHAAVRSGDAFGSQEATDSADEPLPERSYHTPPLSIDGGYHGQADYYVSATFAYQENDGVASTETSNTEAVSQPLEWLNEEAVSYQNGESFQHESNSVAQNSQEYQGTVHVDEQSYQFQGEIISYQNGEPFQHESNSVAQNSQEYQGTVHVDEQSYQSQGEVGEQSYQYQGEMGEQYTTDYPTVAQPDEQYTDTSTYYQYSMDPSAEGREPPTGEWVDGAHGQEVIANREGDVHVNPRTNGLPPAPLSPVATLNGSWSPQVSGSVHAKIEAPPPMFRVAPRLSDIISPLSRSVIAAPAAIDHNVLKPVTPQALAMDSRQSRAQAASAPTVADREFMMTPPSVGPPAFSMSGFRLESDIDPSPKASIGVKHEEEVVNSQRDAHIINGSVAEPITAQDEQFIPAEQVFKPFNMSKPPAGRKSSDVKGGSMLPKDLMKSLLSEFFTTVDKTKLRMVEGYTRRYQGEEAKLFSDLTKKYGAQRVADLKQKFDSALLPLPTASVIEASSTPLFEDHSAGNSRCTPPPVSSGKEQVCADRSTQNSPCQSQTLTSTAPSDVAYTSSTASQYRPHLNDTDMVTASTHRASSSPKVSPKVARRGPPLPFAFDEAGNEMDTPGLVPPPPVFVNSPPASMQSRPIAASSPPRLAPTPPRAPPPPSNERSPVRNGSVLRQRVSPQGLGRPPSSGATHAVPLSLSPSAESVPSGLRPSPPKPAGSQSPVTLESLLNEFYRKHQPDRLKNVPEVVRQYTGKERELIILLKKKYGALSIKLLEHNLEVLEQQGAIALSSSRGSRVEKNSDKKRARGCFNRVVLFVIKVVVLRLGFTLLLLGGLVFVDHSHCQEFEEDSVRSIGDCRSLQEEVATFDMWHLTQYAKRVDSKACFCSEWTSREDALKNEPSVSRAVDLFKLTPFSRTIVEPAFFQLIDSYAPDLPYRDYYETYARPVIQSVMVYGDIGYVYVKAGYGKVDAHLSQLPWDEYYETYGKPAGEATIELFNAMSSIGGQIYADVGVFVQEQWVQLVEMYNEEVATDITTTGDSSDVSDSTIPSPFEALTKVAMASKSLVEPLDTNRPPRAEGIISEVGETASFDGQDREKADEEKSIPNDTTVEIVVGQAGLNLDYSNMESALHTENDETTSSVVEHQYEVDDIELSREVGGVFSAVTQEISLESITKNDQTRMENDDEASLSSDVSTVVQPLESKVSAHGHEEKLSQGEDNSGADWQDGRPDSEEIAQELVYEGSTHSDSIDEVSAHLESDVNVFPNAQVAAEGDDELTSEDSATIVEHPADSREPPTSEDLTNTDSLAHPDADGGVEYSIGPDEIGNPQVEIPSERAEVITSLEEPLVNPDPSLDDGAVMFEKEDHVEEEPSFLEDLSGVDPLELLDLADLAAAELHSLN